MEKDDRGAVGELLVEATSMWWLLVLLYCHGGIKEPRKSWLVERKGAGGEEAVMFI